MARARKKKFEGGFPSPGFANVHYRMVPRFNPHAQPPAPAPNHQDLVDRSQMDMDDVSEDDEEEGGVSLPADHSPDDFRGFLPPHAIDTLSRYQQQPMKIAGFWDLPVAPLSANVKSQLRALKATNMAAHVYHKHCDLISRAWGCHPAECIPLEMREHTPYSLALLSQIRRLASQTKGDIQAGHSLLAECWQDRTAELAWPGPESAALVSTDTALELPCESHILENMYGLTLEDARHAFRSVRLDKKFQKKAAAAEAKLSALARKVVRNQTKARLREEEKTGKTAQSEIANSVVGRRKMAKAAREVYGRQMATEDELVDVKIGYGSKSVPEAESPFTAPPNSPAQPNDRIMRYWSKPIPHHDSKPIIHAKPSDSGPTYASMEDQHEDGLISRMLDDVDFGKTRKPRHKKLKKLQEGGASRKRHPGQAMPLDKVDFNALPSLASVFRKANEEETSEVTGYFETSLPMR